MFFGPYCWLPKCGLGLTDAVVDWCLMTGRGDVYTLGSVRGSSLVGRGDVYTLGSVRGTALALSGLSI